MNVQYMLFLDNRLSYDKNDKIHQQTMSDKNADEIFHWHLPDVTMTD